MAVKVMVAPAIAAGELERKATRRASPDAAPRAKRRRSSVYDAEGNEVFITLMCLKCHKMRPLSQFGLRRMADGAIRNQPWCRMCRSAPADRRARAAERTDVDASCVTALPSPGEAAAAPPEPQQPSRNVAAEIAAALAAGMRR